MGDTIRASELGLDIIEFARQKKGWTRTCTSLWWDLANTSRATLRRFWRRMAIQRDAFQEICRAVGVRHWQWIALDRMLPETLASNLEALYWWVAGYPEVAERLAPGIGQYFQQFPESQLLATEPQPPAAAPLLVVFYCFEADSDRLARELQLRLSAKDYRLFLAGDRQQQGLNWVLRLARNLAGCDGLLVLLSPAAARSEWLAEAVRQGREQQVERGGKPLLIPIRVGSVALRSLSDELQGYLSDLPLWDWHSPADTPGLVQVLCQQLRPGSKPPIRLLPKPEPEPEPPSRLEIPGGQVDLTSRFYIPRPPIEAAAIAAVLQPGMLIRIKAPRQMGKTSLMARIVQRGRQANYHAVTLSFQYADSSFLNDLDRLLQWFCAHVSRQLKHLALPQRPSDTWDATYSSKDNCTIYFEDYLLPQLSQPLVLGLDEVDCVFRYPAIAADFFSLLRAWYDAGRDGDRPLWQQLRLIVVHSTEVYVPLALNRSPFNVGLPVVLPELSSEQVQQFATLYGLSPAAVDERALMAMVGGHPYLVHLALYHIVRDGLTLAELLTAAPTEAGIYSDHLRRHLWQLEQHAELAEAVEDVVVAETPVRLETAIAFKLHSMGLVRWAGNCVEPRCELYRRYFRDCFGAL